MKSIYAGIICFLFLISHTSNAQYRGAGRPFRGSLGITFGYSSLDASDLQHWMATNNGSPVPTNFLNIGVEGFIVRKRAVFGVNYIYDGPASFRSQYGTTSPKNDKIGFFTGLDLMKEYDRKHVLITVGLGYCQTNILLHGNPPPILQNNDIPNNLAQLRQNNFYINPKVTLLYVKPIKFGIEAGATLYLFGNYNYGYNYTYYTYGYSSNGSYSSYSHTQFISNRVQGLGIPNIGNVSFNISAFIGL
jgi:hypothetical protein